MRDNYRLILILLFLCIMSLIVASCKTSKSNCDAYGIHWENPRIDSLAVEKDRKTYVPFIPVFGAREFHMNSPARGSYSVLLKEGNKIVEKRSFVLK